MCEDAKKEMEQLIQGIRTMLEEDADIKRLFIRKTGAGPQVEIAGVGKVSLEEAEKLVGKDVRWSRGEFITENRVPLDRETVLNTSDYVKTKNKVKGASVYKKGDKYFYRDTLHKGERAHLEVFDKKGNHIGEANPLTGEIIINSADNSKKLKIK